MKYDDIKIAESVCTENQFVVNRVGEKPPKTKSAYDALDMAILPVSIGVLGSLGYLIYNIVKATTLSGGINALSTLFGTLL